MFTQNRLNDLQQLAAKIEAKENLLADKLRQLPKSPQEGDIFIFEQGDKLGLEWVVLFPHHKNEQLLLTVPADDNPMAGSTDITISEDALCGPLTLRCSQGMWIHKTDFDMESRVGILENWHWQRALNKTKQIFENNLQSTAWQREKDADPEYKEWMTLVSQDHEALRQALQEKPNECKVIETDESYVPLVIFTFVLSLYPQRKLRLNVNWTDGSALLEQIEPPGGGLQIGDHHFKFEKDDDEWLCEVSPEEVSHIAKALNLPKPYQNWESTMDIKQTLQKRVRTSWSEKAWIFLTAAQQEFMKFLLDTVEKAGASFTDVCYELFFTQQSARRGSKGAATSPQTSDLDKFFKQLVTFETGVVKLSQWLQNSFETMSLSPVRVRSSRSKSLEANARQGKILIELEDSTIILLVQIKPETENTLDITLRVEALKDEHLPEGLQFMVLDKSGQLVDDLQCEAGRADEAMELYLDGDIGEQFSVKISLGSVSLIRDFEI
jgi:hypothetical protein